MYLDKDEDGNTLAHVLNGGYVRYVDHMGSDLSVVRNARVSHNAEWRVGEDEGKDEKLIKYLMSHGHNTPFEACTLTVEVKAPIFVLRQWHRHRTQSYNEVSARYTELPADFYCPDYVGVQSKINHQAREDEENLESDKIVETIWTASKEAFGIYHKLLDMGCPREIARTVLPLNTYSRMFATANLHNWFRFIKERVAPGAQYEIQQYARGVEEIIKELYPICWEAAVDAG